MQGRVIYDGGNCGTHHHFISLVLAKGGGLLIIRAAILLAEYEIASFVQITVVWAGAAQTKQTVLGHVFESRCKAYLFRTGAA
jgi:hypothetical protein